MDREKATANEVITSLVKLREGVSDLFVNNSGVVRLQFFEDPPDGNLAIAEASKNIPFDIKRVYFINSLDNPDAIRGKHAHKHLKQAIFCINGSFTLELDDGSKKQRVKMDTPYAGVILDGLLWHKMTGFSEDCVILVFANARYDPADYIRDYEEFLELARSSI